MYLRYLAAVAAALFTITTAQAADRLPVPYGQQDAYLRELIRGEIGHDPLLERIFGCESTGDLVM